VPDFAASVAARGKIHLAARAGTPIPPGWALDNAGLPTTDPVGGYKGYGLALMIEALSSVLGHGPFWAHMGGPLASDFSRPAQISHAFGALEVDAFIELGEFRARMDEMAREIKGVKRARGVVEIFLPGEIEWRCRDERLHAGIPVDAPTLHEWTDAAERFRVPLPAPLAPRA